MAAEREKNPPINAMEQTTCAKNCKDKRWNHSYTNRVIKKINGIFLKILNLTNTIR